MAHMKHVKTVPVTSFGGTKAVSNVVVMGELFPQAPAKVIGGDYTDQVIDVLGNKMITDGNVVDGDLGKAEAAYGYAAGELTFSYGLAPNLEEDVRPKTGGPNQPSSPYTPNLGSQNADGDQPATPDGVTAKLDAVYETQTKDVNALNPSATSKDISSADTLPPGQQLKFGVRPSKAGADSFIKYIKLQMKTKTLFEEAIADIASLTEAAEDSAKAAVLEAITPSIKKLVAKNLFSEAYESDGDESEEEVSGVEKDEDKVITDSSSAGSVQGVVAKPMDESEEKDEALGKQVEEASKKLHDRASKLLKCNERIRRTSGFTQGVNKLIETVKDIYQECKLDENNRKSVSEATFSRLQETYRILNEEKIKNMRKGSIRESDMTLKLTGLPDDVDLDTLGVELIDDEGEEGADGMGDEGGEDLGGGDEGGGEDLDLGGEDLGGDEGGGDVDLGGDEGDSGGGDEGGGEDLDMGGDDEEPKQESRKLRDNVVLEVSQKELMRELRRGMISEKKSMASNFGGGKEEGDPLDCDITTEGLEGEDLMGEVDEVEGEELEECDAGMGGDMGPGGMGSGGVVDPMVDDPMNPMRRESLNRIKKLQTEANYQRGIALAAKKAGKVTIAKLAESKALKLENAIKESKSAAASHANRAPDTRAVESQLRKQLGEALVNNAKLFYASKVLRDPRFSSQKRDLCLKHLDEAKTSREVKLVYESITSTASSNAPAQKRPLTEGTRGAGSSAPMRSSAPRITEAVSAEVTRWGILAGIKGLQHS